MANVLLGKPVSDALIQAAKDNAQDLIAKGITPTLAIVRVGAREDDISYEKGATKKCAEASVAVVNRILPQDCTQDELLEVIHELNADAGVHGILLFRPLPQHIDTDYVSNQIDASKDVDCATLASLTGVFCANGQGFAPCTPQACMELLKFYEIPLVGKRVAVVGRSLVVGKPLAMLLLAANATPIICHSKTENMTEVTSGADIVISAMGKLHFLTKDYFSSNQTVLDVGINWNEETQKVSGDVDYDNVEPIVSAITPVPRGIGSVTTAVLVSHVVEAALKSCK